MQGPLKSGKQKGEPIVVDKSAWIPLTVVVDLKARKVTLTAKKVVVDAPLARPLKAVTHVGYAVDGAHTEFSRIDVTGE